MREPLNKKLGVIIQILIVVLTLAGSVYAAFTPADSVLRWYNVDDAFFYYKVAQNALAGHGFTFDQINLSNGFHPLWMVVCLGVFWLSKFNLVLPLRVLIVVSGLFNAATSLVLLRFLKKYIHPWAAVATALFWGLSPSVFGTTTVLGMESAISVFFIVLLLVNAVRILNRDEQPAPSMKDMLLLGLIGALTILARLDNVFVVGAVGVFTLLKIKKIPTPAILDVLVVAVSVFVAWIIRLGSIGIIQNTYSVYPMLAVSVLVKPIFLYFAGSYQGSVQQNRLKTIFRVAIACAAAFVFEYGALYILYKANITKMFSNSIIAMDAAIGMLLVLAVHLSQTRKASSSDNNPFKVFGGWLKAGWKRVLLGGVAYSIPIAVLIGGYMLYNKFTFGSFSPVSGQIKHWWSTMPNTVYGRQTTFLTVLGLGTAGNGPWSLATSWIYRFAELTSGAIKGINTDLLFGILVALLLVLFIILMKAENGKLARKAFLMLVPAILVGCIIHITYYNATGYTHTRGWYWMAEMVTLALAGSLLADAVFTWVDRVKLKQSWLAPVLVLVIAIGLTAAQVKFLARLTPFNVPPERQESYLEEVKQVEFYTEPGSKIGMTGGGLVGYFIQDRTVVNLDGLINSLEYFNAMKSGKATEFLDAIPLGYAYGKPYTLLESDPYDEIFKDRLEEIGFIRGYENFTLFRYVIKN